MAKRKIDKHEVIKKVLSGDSQKSTAKAYGVSESTLSRWMKLYRLHGQKVFKVERRGAKSKLKEAQKLTLVRAHKESPFPNGNAMINYVHECFGVTYSARGIDYLAKSIGIEFKGKLPSFHQIEISTNKEDLI